MNKNICTECSTENEEEYAYCKNCGAKLKTENTAQYVPPQQNTYTQNDYRNQSNRYGANPFFSEFIEGVPQDEVALFVGAKSYKIMPKFCKMEITGSKVSWCWPAALLSFFFGPLGAAIWFFYRKMPKIAAIFLCIGIAVTAATTILTYDTKRETFEQVYDSFDMNDPDSFFNSLEQIESETTVWDMLASLISDAASTASLLVTGLFGYHFYKKHCVKKISEFKRLQTDGRFYRIGLASIGGVSSGMLILGIAALILISNIPSYIIAFTSLIRF